MKEKELSSEQVKQRKRSNRKKIRAQNQKDLNDYINTELKSGLTIDDHSKVPQQFPHSSNQLRVNVDRSFNSHQFLFENSSENNKSQEIFNFPFSPDENNQNPHQSDKELLSPAWKKKKKQQECLDSDQYLRMINQRQIQKACLSRDFKIKKKHNQIEEAPNIIIQQKAPVKKQEVKRPALPRKRIRQQKIERLGERNQVSEPLELFIEEELESQKFDSASNDIRTENLMHDRSLSDIRSIQSYTQEFEDTLENKQIQTKQFVGNFK